MYIFLKLNKIIIIIIIYFKKLLLLSYYYYWYYYYYYFSCFFLRGGVGVGNGTLISVNIVTKIRKKEEKKD